MADRKRIYVVMGGPSEEHEISLKTGYEIITHLDTALYDVSALVISREKLFYLASTTKDITPQDFEAPENSHYFAPPANAADTRDIWDACDVAFLGLHGSFGEDGVIQGYLETLDIPYTGCGVTASAIGMHKTLAKKVFEASGIPTPPYSVYRAGDSIERIAQMHGFPCFVKAPQSGSSKLLGRADSQEELHRMLEEFIQEADSVLVETTITGDEFSCPVLQLPDGSAKALPPVYIKPKIEGHFFDYEAKYKGESEEICPIPHNKSTEELIQRAALAVHTVLECRGLSRTDIIIHDEIPYVLEVNTLPGFTSESLFPKAYKADGGTFSELLNTLIATSLSSFQNKK